MSENISIEQEGEQSTGFLEAVTDFFSPGFIFESMLARCSQRVGTPLNELRQTISHNDILTEWRLFVKEQAVQMTNFIRDARERSSRVETDRFVREITPAPVLALVQPTELPFIR